MWGRNPDILAGGIGGQPACFALQLKFLHKRQLGAEPNIRSSKCLRAVIWGGLSSLQPLSSSYTTSSWVGLARSQTRCIFQNFVTWVPSRYIVIRPTIMNTSKIIIVSIPWFYWLFYPKVFLDTLKYKKRFLSFPLPFHDSSSSICPLGSKGHTICHIKV